MFLTSLAILIELVVLVAVCSEIWRNRRASFEPVREVLRRSLLQILQKKFWSRYPAFPSWTEGLVLYAANK